MGKEEGSNEAEERKEKRTNERGNGGEKGARDVEKQESKIASSAVIRILY
jgi:hypothetical protein